MRSASQIASDVLVKLSADEWNAPQLAAAGGGIGTGLGLGLAGISRWDDISGLLRTHYQRPQLEGARGALDKLLTQLKTQQPEFKDFPARKLTKVLLQNELPPEMYHTARKGYEEGIVGLSRNRRLSQLFKKRLMRTGILGGVLGLGAGVGGGLLAAAGSGKFD
jgi:hypothetical protein